MATFSNVEIQGLNRPSSEHDLSHVVNTTSTFGSVFPLNVQNIPIKSTVQIACSSAVRLDPLVAPTFGNLYQHFTHTIVPCKLLYPYYENVILHTPVNIGNNTVIPTYLPYIGSFTLTLLILSACKSAVTIYKKRTDGNFDAVVAPLSNSLFSQHLSVALGIRSAGADYLINGHPYGLVYIDDSHPDFVDPAHCDFSTNYTFGGDDYFITFTFTNRQAHNLYKHFLASGYKPTININDDYDVCLLPLMACAKSYFDSYRISMYDNYKDSPIYALYSHYLTYLPTRCNVLVSNAPTTVMQIETDLFVDLLIYLGTATYSSDVDFVSAHIPRPDLPAYDKNQFDSFNYLRQTGYGADVSNNFNTSGQTAGFTPGNNTFGQLDDELLKLMYYSANKTSQTGYQLEKLLRQRGYDTYVDECVGSFIGRDSFPIQINAITSLAETADGQLGEFAGVSAERNESDVYNVEITEPSYVVTLMSICPDDGFAGTLDKTVLGVDQFSCYNPEFDGFGYEVSPKSVYGKFDQFFETSTVHDKQSFGVIPRYTGFKTRQPLVMGDMIRPKYMTQWTPYFLQKMVLADRMFAEQQQNGSWHLSTFINQSVPNAGKDWRYPVKYPWLSNFNRIFRKDGIYVNTQTNYITAEALENIAVHTYFHFKAWNKMLPVSRTFETIDKDNNNGDGTTTVSK